MFIIHKIKFDYLNAFIEYASIKVNNESRWFDFGFALFIYLITETRGKEIRKKEGYFNSMATKSERERKLKGK